MTTPADVGLPEPMPRDGGTPARNTRTGARPQHPRRSVSRNTCAATTPGSPRVSSRSYSTAS